MSSTFDKSLALALLLAGTGCLVPTTEGGPDGSAPACVGALSPCDGGVDGGAFPELMGTRAPITVTRPMALAAIDASGDGRVELAVAAAQRVELFGSDADGGFSSLGAAPSSDLGFYMSLVRATAPDGGVELGVLDHNSSALTVLSVGSAGDLTARGTFTPVDRAGGNALAAADFDGDGRGDMAVLSAQNVFVGLGTAADGFAFGPALLEDLNAPEALAAADLNADGKLDLAVGVYGAPRMITLLGNGDGTFGPPTTWPAPFGTESILAADVDRDGRVDLVVGGRTFGVEVFLGTAGGTFAPGQRTTGFGAYALLAGDFEGDGGSQLAAADLERDRVVVLDWRDGRFQVRGSHPVGDTPRALALGDFNHDGRLDLAVACDFANQVEFLFDLGH